MMIILVVASKRICVLVLEWNSMPRVKVLVFVNWNLYKRNFLWVFLSKRERFWPWKKANLVFSSLCFGRSLMKKTHTLIIIIIRSG